VENLATILKLALYCSPIDCKVHNVGGNTIKARASCEFIPTLFNLQRILLNPSNSLADLQTHTLQRLIQLGFLLFNRFKYVLHHLQIWAAIFSRFRSVNTVHACFTCASGIDVGNQGFDNIVP